MKKPLPCLPRDPEILGHGELGNTLLICSVRLMPSRLISCGLSPVMSRPRKNTRPLSARSRPETRLKKVVLPAPFGPMIACSRPPAG